MKKKKLQINNTGFFVVQPGETITITVTADDTAYLAAFPDAPSGAVWSSNNGPAGVLGPAHVTESRQFVMPVAPGSRCFVALVFDFQSDVTGAFPPTAQYDIKVEGSLSGSFDDFPVVPPPIDSRLYKFQA